MDTDERTDMGTPKPRRANPMQPDRPTGADDLQEGKPSADRANHTGQGTKGAEEQEQNAIDNVSEGYGKG